MRPRLKSLTLSGFRSFVDDDQTIEFPESGLTLLRGLNKDTGGSSGSGKSSVLMAIAFALGYAPYPATALLTRGGKNSLNVDLRLQTDQGEVRIRRSTTPATLWVNGEQVRGGAKAVETRLAQIFGVDPEILALLTYRGQRKPGLFLSKTDAEKKELLTRLIPRLIHYEQAIETGQTKIKELEVQELGLRGQLDQQRAMLEPYLGARDPAEIQRELDVARRDLAQDETTRNRAKSAVENLTEQRKVEAEQAFKTFAGPLSEAERELAGLPAPALSPVDPEVQHLVEQEMATMQALAAAENAARERFRIYRARQAHLQEKVLACRQVAAQRTMLETEQERLEKHLAALNEQTCPTCLRPWDHSDFEIGDWGIKLKEVTAAIKQCQDATEQESRVQAEIEGLPIFEPDPAIAKLREERARFSVQLASRKEQQEERVKLLQARHLQEKAQLEAQVMRLRLAQEQARTEVWSRPFPELTKAKEIHEQASTRINRHAAIVAMLMADLRDAATNQTRKEKIQQQVIDIEREHTRVLADLADERDLLTVIKDFLGSIFDEVLEAISAETNKILAAVANTRHCTLHFRSESVTQKGTVRKNIVPVVTVDGIEAPLEAGTSGGMLSAIELAVDLAVGKVVTEREGVSPGWLILDESFTGLGPVEMESCLEILRDYAQDRLVLVVDHASEFKSMFPSTITVEYEAGRSQFVRI